jgi:hypothetical protein
MKTIEQCKLQYPKPSWIWNPIYKWVFVGAKAKPVLNKEAIPEWENNIVVWKGAVHDYSAQVTMMEAHIAEAKKAPNDHAKNPYFIQGHLANDAAYAACRNS